MTKEIELTRSMVALVDDEDYEWLNQWNWYAKESRGNLFYALRARPRPGKGSIQMHRLVIDAPAEKMVDHINGNSLDNRKSNLRLCNHSENAMNMRSHGALGMKGVQFRKDIKRFVVRIKYGNKMASLGYYESLEFAAKAYDFGAIAFYGKYARLNYPDIDYNSIQEPWMPVVQKRIEETISGTWRKEDGKRSSVQEL